MRYKIIGDSCLDLTKEMRKDPVYTLIPFTLMVGDISLSMMTALTRRSF